MIKILNWIWEGFVQYGDLISHTQGFGHFLDH